MSNPTADQPPTADAFPTLRPSLIARMPRALFGLLCVASGFLVGSAIFIVTSIVVAIVLHRLTVAWALIPLLGFIVGLVATPAALMRRRKLALRVIAPPNDQETSKESDEPTQTLGNPERTSQAIQPAFNRTPATLTDEFEVLKASQTEAEKVSADTLAHNNSIDQLRPAHATLLSGEDLTKSDKSAAKITPPEAALQVLNVNQNRRATGFILAIALFSATVLIGDSKGTLALVGVLALVIVSLYFLLIRKTQIVNWNPLPTSFIEATKQIGTARNIKGTDQPRFKLRIQKSFWGITYNFPVVTIVAETKSQLWPRFLLLGPDYCYWREGFIFSRGGWRFIKTSDLRAGRFYFDEPAPGFHFGQKVVGHTWKHATMSGDRDHRFKSNREIDLVRRYGIEIKVADNVEWSFTTSEDGRELIHTALTEIVSAAKSAQRAHQ